MFSRQGNNRKTLVTGKHQQSYPSNRVCGIKCIKYILFGAVVLLSVGLLRLNKYVFTTTTGRTSSYPFRRIRNKKQQERKQNDREPKLQMTRGDQVPKGKTPICDVPTVMDAIPLIRSKTHIVQPPRSPFTLVCCQTTQGSLSIAVHPHWAPRGAHRFLSMVESWYFSSKVPFFRCLKGFICQFGIAGDPKFNDKDLFDFSNTMLDDPNWLPEGPEGRVRDGKFRFSKGYLAYAGSGPNSRSNQFIVALKENKFLGGGSPWEVPFGEIIGESSLSTLDKLYTGYDEKGPSQARLYREGMHFTLSSFLFYLQCSCPSVWFSCFPYY
jgi:cyclophilin family peptidyl-prolyl cis-trans isomerase